MIEDLLFQKDEILKWVGVWKEEKWRRKERKGTEKGKRNPLKQKILINKKC